MVEPESKVSGALNPSAAPSVSRRGLMQSAGGTIMAGAVASVALSNADAAPSTSRPFEGRVAVITGGARGQGRSHAVRLAREGASIVLVDILEQIGSMDYPLATQADMDEAVRLVQSEGQRCLPIKADVRDAHATNGVIDRTLHEFGKIDILLANAGILGGAPLAKTTDQMFEDTIRTNLFGVFNYMRAVLPSMIDRNYGRIVVTSSQAGRMGYDWLSHYSASKWGVIGLVKSAALEVAKNGITVNAVCPTAVNTPMGNNPVMWAKTLRGDPTPTREKFEAKMRANASLPQGVPWVEPEEVTDAVLFLASERSRHITGSVVDIQAGAAAANLG